MKLITYGVFNDCYRSALDFKHGLIKRHGEELPLMFRFRAGNPHDLLLSLGSFKKSIGLPDVMLFFYPFKLAESQPAISMARKEFPELKILVLTDSREKKLIFKAFNDGANGVIDMGRDDEALFDACLYLREHLHLHNLYFDLYHENLKQIRNNPAANAEYIPDETEKKIAGMLRDSFTEKEIAATLGMKEHDVKRLIGKINNAIGNDKRKSIGIVLWFIRHGFVSDVVYEL